jgi:hypothetical protein
MPESWGFGYFRYLWVNKHSKPSANSDYFRPPTSGSAAKTSVETVLWFS